MCPMYIKCYLIYIRKSYLLVITSDILYEPRQFLFSRSPQTQWISPLLSPKKRYFSDNSTPPNEGEKKSKLEKRSRDDYSAPQNRLGRAYSDINHIDMYRHTCRVRVSAYMGRRRLRSAGGKRDYWDEELLRLFRSSSVYVIADDVVCRPSQPSTERYLSRPSILSARRRRRYYYYFIIIISLIFFFFFF